MPCSKPTAKASPRRRARCSTRSAPLAVDDYRHPAAHAVEQVVAMMRRYADPARQRAEIEAGAAP